MGGVAVWELILTFLWPSLSGYLLTSKQVIQGAQNGWGEEESPKMIVQ